MERVAVRMCAVALLVLLAAGDAVGTDRYAVPEPRLEALWPHGIRVSIPDSAGVELFAFHGSVNKPLRFLAAGDMSRDILRTKDGRWVFEDRSIRLQLGDVVYYWLYVQVEGLGYQRTNLYWIIDSYVSDDPAVVPSPTGVSQPGAYTVPEATVEALHPKGLRVSIPDSPEVALFAFHGNVNQPMYGLDAGMMSKDILRTQGGRWVFEEPDLHLKIGDVIYYWTYVLRNGLGYRKDNQVFVVKELLDTSNANTLLEVPHGSVDGPPEVHPEHTTTAPAPSPPGTDGPEAALPEGLEFVVTVKDGKFQLKPLVLSAVRQVLEKGKRHTI